jgi:hypothetical protein
MATRGKPKGLPKSGGRVAGTKNKQLLEKEKAIAASGLTPLDYMLGLLRDEAQDQEVRLDAAKSAAPYCHARLTNNTTNITATLTVEEVLKRVIAGGGS